MSKQKIEVEVPEGFEATGDFREPRVGESYIGIDGDVLRCNSSFCPPAPRIILKPVKRIPKVGEVWEDVTDNNCPYLIVKVSDISYAAVELPAADTYDWKAVTSLEGVFEGDAADFRFLANDINEWGFQKWSHR